MSVISGKKDLYGSLSKQAQSVINNEYDWTANLANLSAILFHQLEDVNWAGFYLYKDGELVLGPFQGQVACIRIPIGKGVCGTAAITRTTQVVADVHAFAGHIACDAASNSEIVVPIVVNGELIGVLDIDSPLTGRFDTADKQGLEHFVAMLVKHYEQAH